MPGHFEGLRDRLLRGGVAPRHVTRYLTELTEHVVDLVAEEKRAGSDHEAAVRTALTRIGDLDSLAQTMLSRKELRSWSNRLPWAVFLLGPLLALVDVNILDFVLPFGILVLSSGVVGTGMNGVELPSWFPVAFRTVTDFNSLLLPLVLGSLIAFIAVRQRMPSFWPIIGLVVVSLFCGLQESSISFAPGTNWVRAAGETWPFLPFWHFTIAMGIRVVLNLGLTTTLYIIWRSRREYPDDFARNRLAS